MRATSRTRRCGWRGMATGMWLDERHLNQQNLGTVRACFWRMSYAYARAMAGRSANAGTYLHACSHTLHRLPALRDKYMQLAQTQHMGAFPQLPKTAPVSLPLLSLRPCLSLGSTDLNVQRRPLAQAGTYVPPLYML
jgi:hypothetical protein